MRVSASVYLEDKEIGMVDVHEVDNSDMVALSFDGTFILCSKEKLRELCTIALNKLEILEQKKSLGNVGCCQAKPKMTDEELMKAVGW